MSRFAYITWVAVVWSAYLSPPLVLASNLPWIRAELILSIGGVSVLVLADALRGERPARHKVNVLVLALWAGAVSVIGISATTGTFLGFHPVAPDFFEWVKALQVAAIVILARAAVRSRGMSRVIAHVMWAAVASAFVVLLQVIDVGGVGDLIREVYVRSAKGDYYALFGRATGTFGNPNSAGFALAIGFGCALSRFVMATGVRSAEFVLAVLLALAVALTLSRSALAAMAISAAALVTFGLLFGQRRQWARVAIAGTVTLGLTIGLAAAVASATGLRIDRLVIWGAAGDVTSFEERQLLWSAAIDYIRLAPATGVGPAKGYLRLTVDNEWLLITMHYGLIGLMIIGAIMATATIRAAKLISHPEGGAYAAPLFATIATAVFGMTAPVFHDLQVMPITITMLALAFFWRRAPEGEVCAK